MANNTSSSGGSFCSVMSPQGGHATASAAVTGLSFFGGFFTATEQVMGSATGSPPPPGGTQFGSGSASGFADLSLELDTSGPARSGFVQFTWNVSIDDAPVPNLPGNVSILRIGAYTAVRQFSANDTITVAVELGQPFFFDLSSQDAAAIAPHDDSAASTLTSGVTLQFFEHDGTTSVPVFESGAPEPCSLALFAIGAGVLVLRSRRGRSARPL